MLFIILQGDSGAIPRKKTPKIRARIIAEEAKNQIKTQ